MIRLHKFKQLNLGNGHNLILNLSRGERLHIIKNLLGNTNRVSYSIGEYELSILSCTTKRTPARYWINIHSPILVYDNSIPVSSTGEAFDIIPQKKGTYRRVHTNGFYRKRIILLVDALLSYAHSKMGVRKQ